MPGCCVWKCRNKTNTDSLGQRIFYHRFPDQFRRNARFLQWMSAVMSFRNDNYTYNIEHRVCSKHFNICDYQDAHTNKDKSAIQLSVARPRLKELAVPLIAIGNYQEPMRGNYQEHRRNATYFHSFLETPELRKVDRRRTFYCKLFYSGR
jgi:hypothetical protein